MKSLLLLILLLFLLFCISLSLSSWLPLRSWIAVASAPSSSLTVAGYEESHPARSRAQAKVLFDSRLDLDEKGYTDENEIDNDGTDMLEVFQVYKPPPIFYRHGDDQQHISSLTKIHHNGVDVCEDYELLLVQHIFEYSYGHQFIGMCRTSVSHLIKFLNSLQRLLIYVY